MQQYTTALNQSYQLPQYQVVADKNNNFILTMPAEGVSTKPKEDIMSQTLLQS